MGHVLRRGFRLARRPIQFLAYLPRRLAGRLRDARAKPPDGCLIAKRIRCAEVWGGIENADLDAIAAGVHASLFSQSSEGGKGGDIYYLSVCGSEALTRVAIADVSGHGAAVSHISRWLYDALLAQMNSLDGSRVLDELNDLANHYGYKAISTVSLVAYYRRNGQAYVSYAGHPPALLFRHAENAWSLLEPPRDDGLVGLPLGVSEETTYRQNETPLHAGDRIVLYTDGVLEATNSAGEQFGVQRLLAAAREIVDRPLADLKNSIVAAVRAHTGGSLEHDDVTVIAMERNEEV